MCNSHGPQAYNLGVNNFLGLGPLHSPRQGFVTKQVPDVIALGAIRATGCPAPETSARRRPRASSHVQGHCHIKR